MSAVCCFGELLFRLSPQLGGEWIRQSSMPVYIGGAELNAATALSIWGVPVQYCTALPNNYLAEEVCRDLRSKGIGTDSIIFTGSRIGSYYLPQGADLKNAGVIYDRSHSSFSELKRGQVDWDKVLYGISWFHFSAISPALTANVADLCLEAVQAASAKNITVSVDLNFRSRLWQWGASPLDIMPRLVEHCDVVMGNIWAAENMLGIALPKDMKRVKPVFLQQAADTSQQIIKKFPRVRQVANTFRFDGGTEIHYYATLFSNNALLVSKEHKTHTVVDKVGSGDCFMAGLVYGNYSNRAPQDIIDFATAAAFNKLFIKGDATTSSVEDIRRGSLKYA